MAESLAHNSIMKPLTLYEQPSLAVPQALDRMEFLGQELYAFCGASG